MGGTYSVQESASLRLLARCGQRDLQYCARIGLAEEDPGKRSARLARIAYFSAALFGLLFWYGAISLFL
jgi:hypothetical protein